MWGGAARVVAAASCPIRKPKLQPHLGVSVPGDVEELVGGLFLGGVAEAGMAISLGIFVLCLHLRFGSFCSDAVEERRRNLYRSPAGGGRFVPEWGRRFLQMVARSSTGWEVEGRRIRWRLLDLLGRWRRIWDLRCSGVWPGRRATKRRVLALVAGLLIRFLKRLRRDEVLQVHGLAVAHLHLRSVLWRLRELVMGDGELGSEDPKAFSVFFFRVGCSVLLCLTACPLWFLRVCSCALYVFGL